MSNVRSRYRSIKLAATSMASVATTLVAGCTGVTVATPAAILQASSGKVSVVAQSTPSRTTAVQSLRLEIASAVLNPGNVSLLAAPVAIDLAAITSGSAFVSTTSAPAGTYSSLTLTFSRPSLSITNTAGNALTLPSGTCAVQTTCTFIPLISNNQAQLTTGIFPLTLVAGHTTSFALTFATGKILQSDDSLDFSSGVDTNTGSPAGAGTNTGNEPLDAETGVIQSVAGGQLTLLSEQGDLSPVIATDGATVFNFPASICAANNISCLTPGEIVIASLSLTSAGVVHADSISFGDLANTQLVEGMIVALSPASNSFQILVDKSFGFASGSSFDESTATVALQPGARFYIASVGYPAVAGASFTDIGSMAVGQTVLVDVSNASVMPNILSSQVQLTDTDASGTISALSANSAFLLSNYSGIQSSTSPGGPVTVQADAGTLYRNFSPANFTALAAGESVSATGPLFKTQPTLSLAARQLSLHSASDQ